MAAQSEPEISVRAAEQARRAAMLTNDVAALDALLDPRLLFNHATGQVDDKPAYLAKMGAGRITYQSIDWSEERITELSPDAALLTGRMVSNVTVEGVEKRLDNRVLAAWVRHGACWRLAAFQSTPLKA
jgi:ketosteroid isomerase-like protein